MNTAEFDKFADEYEAMHARNIRVSGEGPAYFAEYKIKDIQRYLKNQATGQKALSILDFGGGVGTSTPYLKQYFPGAEVVIADVSERSLKVAGARHDDGLACVRFDGAVLPFADDGFDIAFAACVFHHIPHDQHDRLLKEIRRVLKPGGHMFVFEHNPWNPLTLHAVNTCEFDENAELISGPQMRRRLQAADFFSVALRYRIFFPRMLNSLRRLEPGMEWVPLGAQYCVVGAKS